MTYSNPEPSGACAQPQGLYLFIYFLSPLDGPIVALAAKMLLGNPVCRKPSLKAS